MRTMYITCPQCGYQLVRPEEQRCSVCGYRFGEPVGKQRKSGVRGIAAGIGAALLIAAAVLAGADLLTDNGKTRSADNSSQVIAAEQTTAPLPQAVTTVTAATPAQTLTETSATTLSTAVTTTSATSAPVQTTVTTTAAPRVTHTYADYFDACLDRRTDTVTTDSQEKYDVALCDYALVDLDNDGVKELLCTYATQDTMAIPFLITYQISGESVRKCKPVGIYRVIELYPAADGNGLILLSYHPNIYSYMRCQPLTDETEYLADIEDNGDQSYFDREYAKMKQLCSGMLTTFQPDNRQPLSETLPE